MAMTLGRTSPCLVRRRGTPSATAPRRSADEHISTTWGGVGPARLMPQQKLSENTRGRLQQNSCGPLSQNAKPPCYPASSSPHPDRQSQQMSGGRSRSRSRSQSVSQSVSLNRSRSRSRSQSVSLSRSGSVQPVVLLLSTTRVMLTLLLGRTRQQHESRQLPSQCHSNYQASLASSMLRLSRNSKHRCSRGAT